VAIERIEREGRKAYAAFWDAVHDQSAIDALRKKNKSLWDERRHTLDPLPRPDAGIPLCELARLGLHALTADLEWTHAFKSNEQLGHPFPSWFGKNRATLEQHCPEIVGAPLWP
jgi:hypothetical protein